MEVRRSRRASLPRLHGRSQFFRIRSLLTTFFQLARLYVNLVVLPALQRKAHRTA